MLSDKVREPGAKPNGFLKDLIDLENSMENSLIGSDCEKSSGRQCRFWLQEPLHLSEIDRALKIPASFRRFEDRDLHGDAAGYFSEKEASILIAPLGVPSATSVAWVRSVWNRLVG